ncbi:two-component system response regulator [Pseudomonas sp. UL073]|uniref:Two-component system response regulator n=1 Tax=Zestomonas insulae TaxID=2809017 RepID=A0ABS2ILG4_9GAMM|nr:two-component system response regulator [Pseudomonas insulae]MBM7062842.1 two-component system response regulator [Pseudomonas insulae]
MHSILDRGEQEIILLVDDMPDNLELLSDLLLDRYRVRAASSGAKALSIAASQPQPDLILLDVMMPELDGYEVCRQLKANPVTRNIPVIFLTARSEMADEQHGFDLGAADYITKPISPPILLARVRAQLQLKAATDYLRDKSEYLELEVKRRTREIQRLHDATLETMAQLADTRDNPCGQHLLRIELYMRVLAAALARQVPALSEMFNEEHIRMLGKSALLHDIGKLTIPDRILLNPAPLSEADQALMRTHPIAGRDAIERAERRLGGAVSYLTLAKEIAYCHHERWDGSGYPQGLRGEQIPLSARLMAVADCYDELTSRHPYRPQYTPDEAVAQISAASGTHFDPQVVLAFLEVAERFAAIAGRYADNAEALGVGLERLEASLAENIELSEPPGLRP